MTPDVELNMTASGRRGGSKIPCGRQHYNLQTNGGGDDLKWPRSN